jgi:hypothetical protein
MKRSASGFIRALVVLVLFVPAPVAVVSTPPAMASPAEVVAAEPAVEVPEVAEDEGEDPWTARFLAPVVVVIAVVAVGASVSYYVVRIRGRYRVT